MKQVEVNTALAKAVLVVFVSPTIYIIDISVTSIMRISAAESKVRVAYSLAVRPSDSDMRLIAENMQIFSAQKTP
jgi:hypothetical protein